MTRISSILISSSAVVLGKNNGSHVNFSHLEKNQVVEATVLTPASSRQCRLLLQGRQVTAETSIPFQKGERVFLKVLQPGTRPVFKVVDATESDSVYRLAAGMKASGRRSPYDLLSALTEASADMDFCRSESYPAQQLDRMLYRMIQLIKSTARQLSVSDPCGLKQWITSSGLTWEHQLASAAANLSGSDPALILSMADNDLKSLAMRCLADLNPEQGDLSRRLGSFIEELQNLQLLNRYGVETHGRFMLPLPILYHDTLKFGQLLIDAGAHEGSRKNSGDKLVRVTVLLEMTLLGHLYVEICVLKHAVSAVLAVAGEDIRTYVSTHLPEFKSNLKQHGYRVVDLRCEAMEPEALAGMSLVDKIMDEEQGCLNVIA